jgi:hypothetical protein
MKASSPSVQFPGETAKYGFSAAKSRHHRLLEPLAGCERPGSQQIASIRPTSFCGKILESSSLSIPEILLLDCLRLQANQQHSRRFSLILTSVESTHFLFGEPI